MSNSQPSNAKPWILAGVIIALSAVAAAALWPSALAEARYESAKLVGEGSAASGGEAEADFRLATWLDSHNQAAYLGLARTTLAAGKPDEALSELDRAGEGSEAQQLKVRTMLELGRNPEAADAAAALTGSGASEQDLLLAAEANALADRTSANAPIAPRLSSPEALQALGRIQAGGTALAQQLYATGLLQSSSTLLLKQSSSYESNFLLAAICYRRQTASDLSAAAGYLNTAVSFKPDSLEARELLVQVYQDQNNLGAAADQQLLVDKLKSGRP